MTTKMSLKTFGHKVGHNKGTYDAVSIAQKFTQINTDTLSL